MGCHDTTANGADTIFECVEKHDPLMFHVPNCIVATIKVDDDSTNMSEDSKGKKIVNMTLSIHVESVE